MAYQEHGSSCMGDVAHLAQAFLLKFGIADGEHLVNYQDLGFEMGGHRKSEAYIHARRIALDRSVEELLGLGEGDDLVEFSADLGAAHTEDRAVKVDILAAGQFGVKPGANLEQARDP